MKKILILIAMTITISVMAQEPSRISYISLKKDTLILPKDTLGFLISRCWIGINTNKPTILFDNKYSIKQRNEWLNTRTKRKS
jgi:hypothetical protein